MIVAFNVAIGGMRGITYVQAFQFWIKVFAIAVPAIILLLIHFGGLARARGSVRAISYPPRGSRGFTGLTVKLGSQQRVRVPAGRLSSGSCTTGVIARRRRAALGHAAGDRQPIRIPGRRDRAGGARAPQALRGSRWSRPIGGTGEGAPLLVYSLLVATFLGTMGLPHVLVRFYTNPDGHAARRTTVRVLGLLSLFYLFPSLYGAMGRALTPQLYTTGQTDDVVLTLPHAAWPGTAGTILTAITCAGAFAAFLSTSSGLLVSLAGTLSHDVWPRVRHSVPSGVAARRRYFRVAAGGAMVIPSLIALVARQVDISILVGWAFAIAASTFCPLFLLGIWWTRLTARGAACGMVLGMLTATCAIFVGLALGEPTHGALALLQQPAIVSVPVAFLAMVTASLTDRRRIPDADAQMLALHAPEGLGLRLADDEEGALMA